MVPPRAGGHQRSPALLGLPETKALPLGWRAAVAQWGRASVIAAALEFLDAFHDLPLAFLPALL